MPSIARDLIVYTNWVMSLKASGQVATEPLISNEQFGVGGINTVRGYHEGEVFGDEGWAFTAEQKTPPYLVGTVYGRSALSLRGSIYMGYGQTFLQESHQNLWGVGFGGAASIGPNWEAQFLVSWPLISTSSTEGGQPRFDFSLSAQF
jgi:hemolysin activation/secretion protein